MGATCDTSCNKSKKADTDHNNQSSNNNKTNKKIENEEKNKIQNNNGNNNHRNSNSSDIKAIDNKVIMVNKNKTNNSVISNFTYFNLL